ncbi:MAG: bifunctional RNase H/acid phosphatase [Alphaproteobacteria bacterium ADurb.Bin438]|nr:MAG: bifunctional RNase H/acid phosphatase [Alphaproteobacteria bacterium ADurb.Bin438]
MLWLIRHGESIANLGHKTDNPASIPLSENGIVQAKEIANNFIIKPDLIVTSSYIRTLQTATPLIKKYPDTPVETWDVHEFTYLCPKTCVKTTTEERKPRVDKYWEKNDPDYIDGEGAESFNQFLQRVQNLINTNHEDKFIVVFTHELFINACLLKKSIYHLSMKEFFENKAKIKNAKIIKF